MSDIVIAGRGHCCDPFSALKEEIDMAVTIAMNARSIAEEALTTAGVISGNAMKYQGTVGTGGTITSLPAASPLNIGNVYVALESGTFPVTYETGDMLISNGITWVVVPSGDDPVDWSQILNTPTTLGGYGITDAVDLPSTQTITGAKNVPLEATGTFSDQIASSNKVKNELDNYAPMVRTTNNQTIAGEKTFTSPMTINSDGVVTALYVKTRGNFRIMQLTAKDYDVTDGAQHFLPSVLSLNDKNDIVLFRIGAYSFPNGRVQIKVYARNSDGTYKESVLIEGDTI